MPYSSKIPIEERRRLRRKNRERWERKHPDRALESRQRTEAKRQLTPKQKAARSVRAKRWVKNNPTKNRAQKKRWRLANREKFRATQRRSWKKRYASNPAFRLKRVLRNRLWTALRRRKQRKSAKTLTLVGCDVQFLMGYLEARFKPGMSWKNYGTVWEIDHRIPCASYDLSDPSHQRSCFHYTNLQPMWREQNGRKHAKMPGLHQAEML